MPVTTPYDLMADWPGWTTEFELQFRQQHSRQGDGIVRTSGFARPLWRMSAQSQTLKPNAMRALKAKLHGLENGRLTFYGRDLAGCRPAAYPAASSFTDEGTVGSLPAADQIIFAGLPANFAISAGDYFHVQSGASRSLHQAIEAVTADGSGDTTAVEVRPYFPSWVDAAQSVRFVNAVAIMVIMPGGIAAQSGLNGMGTVSFDAIQST